MSEEYSTRKGTRVIVPADIPPGAEDTVIPAGTEGTVVEDTNTQAYRVVWDGNDKTVWTVGAWQVEKTYSPPTYDTLAAIVAAVEAEVAGMPGEAPIRNDAAEVVILRWKRVVGGNEPAVIEELLKLQVRYEVGQRLRRVMDEAKSSG